MTKAEILIKSLIKEHENAGYCTSYSQACEETEYYDTEENQARFYDAGYYEALVEVLNLLGGNL